MKQNSRRIAALVILIALLAMFARSLFRMFHARGVGHSTELIASGGSYAAEANPGSADLHIALGEAHDADASDDYILKRPQYAVSYNRNTHNPNWVSYNLSAWWFGNAKRHRGEFLPDPQLPEDLFHVLHRDYTGSGYDRGHMCRSEERTRNDEDNLSTFYTTNLLPQTHELNAGPWLSLENECKNLCQRQNKELYIIDGPIYDEDRGSIGRDVRVPSSCFKIVVVLEKGGGLSNVTATTKVIAVIMPNQHGADIAQTEWTQYRCTVRDIERKTGYNFLSAVPQEIQDKIENTVFELNGAM